MLTLLTKLLESAASRVGTIVHIGAGIGSELSLYQDLNCQHVLAIEPDDSLFKKLKVKAKRFDNVTVQQSWIANTETERNATIFNNPRFNSLLPADKRMLEHFPNVRSTETLTVKTQSFDELVTSNVKRVDDKLNVLVFDMQGLETTLFENGPASSLQLFDWIIVRVSEEVLFEGGASASEIKSSLLERDFELRLSERTLFPFVEHYYQLNSRAIQLKALNKKNDQLSATSAQQQTEKEQLTAQVSALQAKQNELAEAQKNKDAKIAELTQQRDQQTKAQQEAKQRADALKVQNEQLTAQVSDLQTKQNELAEAQKNKDAKIAELTQQRDQQTKAQQEAKQRADALKVQNEQLTAQVSDLQTKQNELAEAQKNKDAKIAELTQQRDQQTKAQQEAKQRAEALTVQNEQLTAQVSDLQTKQNELAESQKNKDAKIAELTQQRDQQTKAQQDAKQRAEALKVQNEQLTAQVSDLQTKQNELAESQKNKDAKIAELTQQRDQQTKAQQDAKQRAEALKVQNEQLTAQVSDLQTQHKELVEKKKLTDEKLASGEMANSNSLLKIETQVTEISKLIAERDYLSDKNNDLESCIAELDSEVVKLEAQIELVNKVFIQD